MPKRICVTLLFTMVFAIVVLCAATEVVAFTCPDVQCDYSDPDYLSWQCNGQNLEYLGKTVEACGLDPSGWCTRFEYKISGEPPLGSHVLLRLSPELFNKDVASTNLESSDWLCGKADPSTGGCIWPYMAWSCILKLTPLDNSQPFTVTFGGKRGEGGTDSAVKRSSDLSFLAYGPIMAALPGVGLNIFIPEVNSEKGVGAGGKCTVKLIYSDNVLVNVELDPPVQEGCHDGYLNDIDGEPVQYLEGTVTFGNNTTTCYPLSPPWCVCTAEPCPGQIQ